MLPKKTTILILILALVTGLLVFMAVKSEQESKKNDTQTSTPSKTKTVGKAEIEKTATVYFNPATMNFQNQTGSSSANTVDIMIDTGKSTITGVQIELSYDPELLGNLVLNAPLTTDPNALFRGQGSFNVLFNEVDPELGRASFALVAAQNRNPVSGVGKVATLSFSRIGVPATSSTQITFLEKTSVVTENDTGSVLKDTEPLTIFFTQTAPTN